MAGIRVANRVREAQRLLSEVTLAQMLRTLAYHVHSLHEMKPGSTIRLTFFGIGPVVVACGYPQGAKQGILSFTLNGTLVGSVVHASHAYAELCAPALEAKILMDATAKAQPSAAAAETEF